jgi:hypothetical protein
MLVSSVPLSETIIAGQPRIAITASSSREVRRPDSEVSARLTGRLAQIRLSGPGLGAVTRSPAPAAVRIGPAAAAPTLSATANGMALRWDAAANPAVMVRDAATGQVLSFARGGQAVMPAGTVEVDLELSNGVRSRHQRVRAGP